jgi:ubiquinone/menaquinone biosynthesis C-methylase UbiE
MAKHRMQKIRAQYESEQHAQTYAQHRWTETRHARATHRWECRTLERFLNLADLAPSVEPLLASESGARLATTILDLPCGTGRFTDLLDSHCAQLLQGDLAGAMLAQRQNQRSWALQGSLHQLPLADDSVDLAFCFRVLHHFPERELRIQVLRELARVSRKWVLTSYYDAHSLPIWRDRLRGRERSLTPVSHAQFTQEAAQAGLKVVLRGFRQRWFSQQVIALLQRD